MTTIHLVILMGMLSQLGLNGSRISVSLYALELGANQFSVGLLIALYSIFPMLLAISVGKLVDRIGPWLPLMIGVAGMGLALLLPPLFPGMAVLYVACLLLGLTQLFFLIAIESSAGGIGGTDKRASNYTLLTMGWSIANFCGPVIAGFSIDHLGHLQVFWVLASFSVLPMLVFFFKPGLLPKKVKHADKHGHGSTLELWRMPNLRTVYITGASLNSAQSLFQFYFPIYGHSLGISASAMGTILGMVAGAAFVVRSLLPVLMTKRTEAQILIGAVFVAAFAFALIPFVANPYALAAIAFLLGLGTGCSNPLSMSLVYALAPSGRTAEAMGLLRTAYNVLHLVIPVAFGSIGVAFGYAPVFLSNTVILTAGGLLMRKAGLPVTDPRPK